MNILLNECANLYILRPSVQYRNKTNEGLNGEGIVYIYTYHFRYIEIRWRRLIDDRLRRDAHPMRKCNSTRNSYLIYSYKVQVGIDSVVHFVEFICFYTRVDLDMWLLEVLSE